MLPIDLPAGTGLPENQTLEAVEVALARVLTGLLRMSVNITIDDRLRITAFPETGEPIVISLEAVNRKLRRLFLHQIELELQKRRTLLEAQRLKEVRGTVVPGEIFRIAGDGTLFVSLERADSCRRLILAGLCPVRYQPLHERGSYTIGGVREFYITSVLPVMVNRSSCRVRILLSRTSKELPRLLLQERSHVSGILCRKRIPGGYSEIVTPVTIPKDAINSVGKELGEHLYVSRRKP